MKKNGASFFSQFQTCIIFTIMKAQSKHVDAFARE